MDPCSCLLSTVSAACTFSLSFACSVAVEKLKTMDDAFRKQLDRKEEAHQRAMDALAADKQKLIDAANQRVCCKDKAVLFVMNRRCLAQSKHLVHL